MGLEPGTLPSQEKKSAYKLCQAYHLVWGYLSPFQAPGGLLFFCFASARMSVALRHTAAFQVGVFLLPERGAHAGQRAAGGRGEPQGPLCTADAEVALSL